MVIGQNKISVCESDHSPVSVSSLGLIEGQVTVNITEERARQKCAVSVIHLFHNHVTVVKKKLHMVSDITDTEKTTHSVRIVLLLPTNHF